MAAVAPTTNLNVIVACGVNNTALYDGHTQAQRIASKVFDDNFESCCIKSNNEIKEDIKLYAGLTVTQGKIRTHPVIGRDLENVCPMDKRPLLLQQRPCFDSLSCCECIQLD